MAEKVERNQNLFELQESEILLSYKAVRDALGRFWLLGTGFGNSII